MASGFGSWGKTKSGAKVFVTASAMSAGDIAKEDLKTGSATNQEITAAKNKVKENQAARKAKNIASNLNFDQAIAGTSRRGLSANYLDDPNYSYGVIKKEGRAGTTYYPYVKEAGYGIKTFEYQASKQPDQALQTAKELIVERHNQDQKAIAAEKAIQVARKKVGKRTTELNKQYGKASEVTNKLQALFEINDDKSRPPTLPAKVSPEYKKMKNLIERLSTTPESPAKRKNIQLSGLPSENKYRANVYPNGWAVHKSLDSDTYSLTHLASGYSVMRVATQQKATKAVGLLDSMKISGNFDIKNQEAVARFRVVAAIIHDMD